MKTLGAAVSRSQECSCTSQRGMIAFASRKGRAPVIGVESRDVRLTVRNEQERVAFCEGIVKRGIYKRIRSPESWTLGRARGHEREGLCLRFVGFVDPNAHDLSGHRVSDFFHPHSLQLFRAFRRRMGCGGADWLGTGSGLAEVADFAARAVGASVSSNAEDLFDGEHGPILLAKW